MICIEKQVKLLLEVKSADDSPSGSFRHFSQYLPAAQKIQIVKTLAREKTYPDGVEIRSLLPWLVKLELDK